MKGFEKIQNSTISGKGIFATRNFDPGEKVYEYSKGKLIKKGEVSSLSKEEQEHLNIIDKDLYELLEGPAGYVNHSCDPNAVEKDRIGYALKPIKKDEEITVDYRVSAYDEWEMKCNCGSKNCEGIITGNFFSMSKELQKKYLFYAPKFIQEEYKKKNAR